MAIAILALLLIGGGVTISLCGRQQEMSEEIPVVTEHTEMIDSAAVKTKKEAKEKKTKKTSGKSGASKKTPKTYKQRSHLDEPV